SRTGSSMSGVLAVGKLNYRVFLHHGVPECRQMNVPEPSPPMSTAPKPAWMPSRKALLIAAGAFVAGLLLFLALWLDQRDNNRFYRSDEAPRSVEGQVFEPLPTPL